MSLEDDWAGFCRLWRDHSEEGRADDAHGAQFRRAWADYILAGAPRGMGRWLEQWLRRDDRAPDTDWIDSPYDLDGGG